jgi:branched-chain amino acid transport system permease protein
MQFNTTWNTPRRATRVKIVAIVIAVLAVAAPMMLKGFLLFQISTIMAYAVGILGLVVLTGLTGQISLGHGAFFAIGAYAMAILVSHYELSYVLAIPLASLICLVLGYLIGIPAVRLEGLYLALATFSLAVATPQILKHKGLAPWTGGFQGILLDPVEQPKWLHLTNDQFQYVICLFFVCLSLLLVHNLLKGRTGRALESIREHSMAASAMGVDVAKTKAKIFAVSAMLAGLSGALIAILTQFVSPDGFNFFMSISLLVGAVVGGLTTIWGAILGAAFIVLIPNVSESISKAVPWAIYGALLIVVVFLMPSGLAGLFGRLLGSDKVSARDQVN